MLVFVTGILYGMRNVNGYLKVLVTGMLYGFTIIIETIIVL